MKVRCQFVFNENYTSIDLLDFINSVIRSGRHIEFPELLHGAIEELALRMPLMAVAYNEYIIK